MVIQHSPQYPGWGLQYHDTTDKFRFLSNGFNMAEIDLGGQKVVINGGLQVTSGSPAAGKVLTSDASGNASWQDASTKVTAFQPTGCQSLNAANGTFQKIGNMGTFSKTAVGTWVELNVQTNIYVGSFGSGTNGMVYELRIDDVPTAIGKATALSRSAGSFDPVMFIGVFNGLSAGSHTVSLWARATNNGSATNVMWDAGCFNSAGTNNVQVKEYK